MSVYIYQITQKAVIFIVTVRLPDFTKQGLLPWTSETGWFS